MSPRRWKWPIIFFKASMTFIIIRIVIISIIIIVDYSSIPIIIWITV